MARILIVEDSPTNMMLAVQIVLASGHEPLEATNAQQGLAIAAKELPDVILMDMHLPDIDGLAATAALKSDPITRHIPVIALTAAAMKGDREQALAAGCDDYIEKPVRYKTLLAAIANRCT
ncbi:MAG: response regulator [Burkholderiales bacterium]|nr:response regulator [Burkholderiales bacterium]